MSPMWIAGILLAGAPVEKLVVVTDAAVPAADVILREKLTAAGREVVLVRVAAGDDSELVEHRAHITKAKEILLQARRATLELRTSEAIELFEEAQTWFLRGIAAIDDYAVLARSFVEQGAAYIDAGRNDKALAAFKRALAIGAQLKIDPKSFNPSTVAAFQRAQKQSDRAARAILTVVTKPERARVVLDGKDMGETPVSLNDLVPGEHWLVIVAPGYFRHSARIAVAPGTSERAEVFLRRAEDARSVAARALGELRLDGISETTLAALLEVQKATSVIVLAERGSALHCAYAGVNGARGAHRITSVDAVDACTSADRTSALDPPEPTTAVRAPSEREPGPAAAPATRQATAPSAAAPVNVLAPRAPVPLIVAILPFGIGQFAEKRPVAGALLLASQLALVAVNVAVAALYYASAPSAVSGGFPLQTRAFSTGAELDRARALQVVSWVSGIALAADIVAGAIDGGVHR
ncbi:MAG: PEGA domain-containing protein [Deltaproteobacteria bacterium]|nr:PEGA domain-containing protein [Deltaproteobacteria bacterium]